MCNKAYSEKKSLLIHQRTHSGERPYVCDLCNKAFIANSTLIIHQLIHSSERPYTCDMCNKAYSEQPDNTSTHT